MFKRILIATNGEDGLDRLGQCLENFAAGGVQQITFVRGIEWHDDSLGMPTDITPELTAAEQRIRQACAEFPPGLTVEVLAQVGKPADVVLRAIDQFQPEVVILGMRSQSLLSEKLFGNNSMTILSRLTLPALVLRPQLIEAFTLAELRLRVQTLVQFLLVPDDFADGAQLVLDGLKSTLSTHPDPQCQNLLLLHVIDPTTRQYQASQPAAIQQQVQQDLDQVKHQLLALAPELTIRTQIRLGSPLLEILKAAGSEDITAIATASQRVGKLWEWSIPSVTGELLRRSWHPILIFPSRQSGG